MSADEALTILARTPRLIEATLAACIRHLGADWTVLRAWTLLEVDERLDRVVPAVSACAGGDVPLSRVALGALIGARRETVARALSRRRSVRA